MMKTIIIGRKEAFAIEYWSDEEHPLWGNYCLWINNESFGLLSEETYTHLGGLEQKLLGYVAGRNDLYDIVFDGLSDDEIFFHIWNATLNHEYLDKLSDQVSKNLTKRFWKYLCFEDQPTDVECIFLLLNPKTNMYKFLIKHYLYQTLDVTLHAYDVPKEDVINVFKAYCKEVEDLRERPNKKE